jgi:hypothetical protein
MERTEAMELDAEQETEGSGDRGDRQQAPPHLRLGPEGLRLETP